MTRYLITGAGGMLAHDLRAVLADRPVTALARAELDITDPEACRAAVHGHDVVLNTAAYTAVDAAEHDPEAAHRVNALGPQHLARAAAEAGAVLVQYSTDYVFGGDTPPGNEHPWAEDAPLRPISVYGSSKAEGERRARAEHPEGVIIARTAWLYGAHGRSFVTAIRERAATGEPLDVVDDQWGQPTWTHDVAERTIALLDHGVRAGIVHATAGGRTTWFGFARAIVAAAGLDPALVRPAATVPGARAAARPHWSVLGHDGWARLGVAPLRPWPAAFAEAAAAIGWTDPPVVAPHPATAPPAPPTSPSIPGASS
ncbi:dTDP-4-dehydrorhamnose reductase [Microcella humidisoli]|uniref:dTDP-4-dehydrorhamnose reductase n=1 Tax=Microcella humidisoli TaxID=2963406 RepID=A0ABY5FXI7_9MICO|nr:dTDP-4-dehydrorhamnose reductase [Microcella humidisoli]UTT63027.1 dTDP-4-dehydrorhamnose reductase [Microcella humidisoli]